MTTYDKIAGSFLLGACGDALGAPLEGLRTLKEIFDAHGPNGLSRMIPMIDAYDTGVDYPAGRITDDTAMLMTTVAALLMTPLSQETNALKETLRPLMWQAYLNWGQLQDGAEAFTARIDPSLAWSDLARSFWFACGAGRGTIAALSQDGPGSIDTPRDYTCTIRGRLVKSPNPGCGGMMWIAPLAFLSGLSPDDVFHLACDNAAITHGHPSAYVATGAIAVCVHFAAQDKGISEALALTKKLLEDHALDPRYLHGVGPCIGAITHAAVTATRTGASLTAIDEIPTELGFKNPFLAVPVLAQVAYALFAHKDKGHAGIRDSLVLAANHSGDSDSVAAIVGNVLGARYGVSAVPAEWGSTLLQKNEVLAMARRFAAALTTAPPAMQIRPGLG